jgi:uncharacterized protein
MTNKALIVYGGWDGHKPQEVAEIYRAMLAAEGFAVEVATSLEVLTAEHLAADGGVQLLVPCWTMGQIDGKLTENVSQAIARGMGISGCHGGMCDAFRSDCTWQFITGGQFVAHPGNDGTKHTIHIGPTPSPITAGIADFEVATEQYYMHVDPAVRVLAYSKFPVADGPHATNGPVHMPVVWTKRWGQGKVFYSSLGHAPDIVSLPPHLEILRRGSLWAATEAGQK